MPRGAGTGYTGGAVPLAGGVVLSLERMNRILEIDEGNLVAVVEPNVITGELQAAVERVGLFYPPYGGIVPRLAMRIYLGKARPASFDNGRLVGKTAEPLDGVPAGKP